MRKLTSLLLTVVLLLSCTVTAFAAEDDPVEIGVYAKTEQNIDGEYTAPIENGSASVTTPDGTVTVTNAPDNAVTLVVIPMEGEALTWVDGCVDGDAVAAYDIHFRDADGNRINANGAKVSITVSGTDLTVSSVTTSGEDKPLTSEVSGGKVSFTTDGSHYYVIAGKTVEDTTHKINVIEPEGGEVTVSTTTPKTGETVTITVKPDDGKTVDQVKVTDESGKAVTVTDNGDSTYTFTQPDGDVTVEVTFKDEAPAPAEEHKITIEKTSGGKVEVNDDTPVTGQTVTITTKPNSGKVVDKVTVTDENGKTVKVKDNGDGTYSFEQPDGDVTVKVTFKNKPSSGDIPQTGDTMCLHLWVLILLISGMMLIYIGNKMRKQEAE